MIDLECTVYADADTNTIVDALHQMFPYKIEHFRFIEEANEINVMKNLSFDKARRSEFPKGFVYFEKMIEIFPDGSKDVSLENQVDLVGRILLCLWKNGIPAIAACDYEDLLPYGGGNKNSELPWPV